MTPMPLQELLAKEDVTRLMREVEKLPTLMRSLIISALNGVDFGEYAELTGKDYGTCKSSYHQALQKLKGGLNK